MVALTTVAVRAADLTNADAVLNYVLAKTAGYDSYSAAFAENMTMPEDTLQLTGTIAFKRPAQKRKEMRCMPQAQHNLDVVGPDQIMWSEVIIGSTTNVTKMGFQNMPTNHPVAAFMKDAIANMDPNAPFIKEKDRCAFTLLPSVELHGQRMYVLVGELRTDAKLAPEEAAVLLVSMGKQKWFVGQKDGFIYRIEMFDKDGSNTLFSLEYTDVKLDVPLADGLFNYQPAPAANINDISQTILQMMKDSPKSSAAGN